MEKLKEMGIGPEGQLAKVEGVSLALKYLKVAYSDTSDPQYQQFIGDTEIMRTRLGAWKYCQRGNFRHKDLINFRGQLLRSQT
jgi:hypothetical protein